MEKGLFRKDLYYRLFTHSIHLPSLRERKQDIPQLLAHFIGKIANQMQINIPELDPRVITNFQAYDFPGNIRELEAMVYDAMTTHDPKHRLSLRSFENGMNKEVIGDKSIVNSLEEKIIFPGNLPDLQTVTATLVQEAMDRSDNNQTLASKMLGISQPALSKRLKKQKSKA